MIEAKHNRRKKTESIRAKCWCEYCDMAFVGIGEKCHVCGNRMKSKHMKK
ncbi:hypothetical protein LCGC14_1859480 [marine sediment metagenome]|uniref:Uncharacterized protein n=1 Tax=marine sediment metagenome TaxID=412755 RepID=A0A0F9GWD1_9ZZZZ